jgi:hypothetical protein
MRGAISLLAVLATTAHAHPKLTLADLKALIAQDADKEAFVHLGDVPPSERKADWTDVAATASAGVLATVNTDDGTTIALIDEIDRDYPQLVKAPKYAKARAFLGVKGLAGCFAQVYGGDTCTELAVRFVDHASDDRVLALSVAKLVRQQGGSASAVPLFKRVLAGKDKSACKDEDAKIAIVAGLDVANATDAKALVATCWDSIKDDVVKAFDGAGNDGDLKHNTCEILMAKKLLSPLQIKVCNRR